MATDKASGKGRGALETADTEAVADHGDSASAHGGPTGRALLSDGADTIPDPASQTAEHTDPQIRLPTRFEEGDKIGRYLVVETIGEGGMGVVLAAYDPTLDRKVALKLLRTRAWGDDAREQARKRLLREAQAMAKLSHPNVVTVHEVGTVAGRVFIAMEYVDGCTLRDWCRQGTRGWREVCEMFVRAGEGLAAAHRAGLIHRDFKPENVLVGKDGRVRVTDFGLVSTAGTLSSEEEDAGSQGAVLSSSTPLSASLTRTGSLLGTPIYMAPEQHERGKTDARTDQFSFCVALYEVLYRQRPFEGHSYPELVARVTRGELSEPPKDADVPGWIREILRRGLSTDKKERYPSMEALLEALEHDPVVARRRKLTVAAVAAAILVLGGLATYGLVRRGTAASELCKGARQKLAGVWGEDEKAAVEKAFRDTERPYAGDVYVRVEKRLDEYVDAWAAARTEACEATHLHGEQSEDVLDLRMACFDQRLRETRALVELFADKPDTEVLDKAVQASYELPSLARCADVEALRAPFAVPEDPERRAKVELLREQLARAEVLLRTGKYSDARSAAERVVEQARALGYRPLDAESLFLLGAAQERGGSFEEARATLVNAFLAGLASKHDAAMTDAAIHLVIVVGDRLEEHQRGLHWARVARAGLEQRGTGGELTEAMLSHSLGALRMRMGDYDQALARYQESLRIRRKALGDEHPLVAVSEHGLGLTHERLARYDEALAHYRRALAVFEKSLGPEHPIAAAVLNSVGNVQSIRGSHEAAITTYRQVAARMEKSLGPEHPHLGLVYNNIGIELQLLGKLDEAVASLRRGLAIQEKTLGPGHTDVAASLSNLAEVQRKLGELDGAIANNRRALVIVEAALGADHPTAARVRGNLAASLIDRGDYDEARTLLQRSLADLEKKFGAKHDHVALVLSHLVTIAREQGHLREALALGHRVLAIYEEALGPDHPDVAMSLDEMGGILADQGKYEEAARYLERAVRIREGNPGDDTLLAGSRFALARALAASRRDRARAVQLAEQARDIYAEAGERSKDELARVNAWLKQRGAD